MFAVMARPPGRANKEEKPISGFFSLFCVKIQPLGRDAMDGNFSVVVVVFLASHLLHIEDGRQIRLKPKKGADQAADSFIVIGQ